MTNKEAIERLEYIKTHDTDPEDYELFDLAIKALEERPQGEWKHNNFDEHYCNKCGNFALWSEEADDYDYYEVQSNFCPNCGARMEGGR